MKELGFKPHASDCRIPAFSPHTSHTPLGLGGSGPGALRYAYTERYGQGLSKKSGIFRVGFKEKVRLERLDKTRL